MLNLKDYEMHKALVDAYTLGPAPSTASGILKTAAQTMKERAASRDRVEVGERSMKRAVEAFNALTGAALSEVQGWQFMAVLKLARANGGKFHLDDYVDGAAYMALAGEAASAECNKLEAY
ncbi:DUF6378 domain-containing protein [Chromobacterium haemolyticum]|uniref:DUF6378 domain-containing protein n=1 Tax=Chromobacterium haemolyticum TaxID=394935 RepID=UPI001C638047|nr:DUF6378 domain-containing protein [Chromobacterium haemolyticum]